MISAQIKDCNIGEYLNGLKRKEVDLLTPYIPGKPIAEVMREYGLKRVIKLASNENPLGVSERVKEVIREECDNINRYPDGFSRSLKSDLSRKLEITEDMIVFGNGSDGLLKVIAESFLTEDSQVVISYPTFVEYTFVANLMGSQLIRVCMDNYRQNLYNISDSVNSQTRLIFLTNPHNPCGTTFTTEEFDYLLHNIPGNVIVVVDEAYYEYVQNKDYPDMIKYIKEGYPILVLRTLSKAYGLAGLRLGYALARPEITEILMKVRDPFNVNHLAEMAGKAALQDQEFVQKTVKINEEGKEYLYQELDKMGIDYVPTEANFILMNVQTDSTELSTKMLKKGIIVRSGKPLGYEGHIRVTVGLPEENEIFIKCLREILGK